MLDQETKRKIDNARDILVGKVPDPKSQVEQITIALIYKFMDDMDKESEEWGGKATFFTGDYKNYAWSKIFDPRLGGFDLINLYSDAIIKMNQNPNIPQLFRDIFKNAYLPYRDPETLKSFLKEIDEFKYDHSERLGDAFEYLLSVMDSQGDAGQFRTPRHIIDFIVEIVSPKKNETVLDPACGTAGFLISSYKHILKENTKKSKGDQLTTDEKNRLINNFIGYDISPDMVRLSLVNMYLHGFSNPSISEYDTLTSEEKWNDTADVILANPPFMTPKGGIRPNKRFSIQAKRSEVLFVDYIAEHLNPSGRAGVIVPEGIIFQSQNAYKQLRKILVENYLWAVVSLPAGIFNPYSGVKTSVLLMDKSLAKKTNKILFVKIENDGFDLGAQRRPIDKNDIPQSLEFFKDYRNAILNGNEVDFTEFAYTVEKTKIVESGDWNISGSRYEVNNAGVDSKWNIVKVDEILEFLTDFSANGSFATLKANVNYKNEPDYAILVRLTDLRKNLDGENKIYVNKHSYDFLKKSSLFGQELLFANVGANVGEVYLMPKIREKATLGPNMYLVKLNEKVNKQYVFYCFKSELVREQVKRFSSSAAQPKINKSEFRSIKIPLPTIDKQNEIVADIGGYQKIIDGAQQVADNYKPVIKIDPEWDIVSLGNVCQIKPSKSEVKDLAQELEVSFVPMADLNQNQIFFKAKELRKLKEVFKGYTYFRNNDVLLAKITPCFENGKSAIAKNLINGIGFGSTEFIVFRANDNILPEWIYYFISSIEFLKIGKRFMTGSAGQQRVSNDFVNNYKIPLPIVEEQKEIVKQIESEQELVNANKKLISIYEQKIRDKISEVWGE